VAASGEQDRVTTLAVEWTRAQPTVAAFISSLIPRFHDAEDVLQRTAASLVTKYGDYDPDRPFVGWAVGIAKIEVLRYRQERRRDRVAFDDEGIAAVASTFDEMSPQFYDMREALRSCLDRLRGRAREVLELHSVHEMEPSQIADHLGISVNAVFVALHRARATLRSCMEQRLVTSKDRKSRK
jgi:RNA polymerase sigma-70 factor (ECF subfamily)